MKGGQSTCANSKAMRLCRAVVRHCPASLPLIYGGGEGGWVRQRVDAGAASKTVPRCCFRVVVHCILFLLCCCEGEIGKNWNEYAKNGLPVQEWVSLLRVSQVAVRIAAVHPSNVIDWLEDSCGVSRVGSYGKQEVARAKRLKGYTSASVRDRCETRRGSARGSPPDIANKLNLGLLRRMGRLAHINHSAAHCPIRGCSEHKREGRLPGSPP